MSNSNRVVYFVLFFIQLLFAVNFVTTKLIVGVVNPVWWAFIRFFISSLAILLMTQFMTKIRSEDQHAPFKNILMLSFFGVALSQIAFLKGIKLTTSINSAIICSAIPIFTLLILFIRGDEKPNVRNISGIILAFLGVVFIRNFEEFQITNETFLGDLLVLINAMSSAIYIAYSRPILQKCNPWWLTGRVFSYGSVMVFLFAIFEGSSVLSSELTPAIVGSMIYGIVGATLLSYLLINWSLTKIDSGKVSFFIYLQPPLTSILALIFLNEPITLRMILASLLIIAGFVLTLKPSRLKERA